jgi:hypothetical protein
VNRLVAFGERLERHGLTEHLFAELDQWAPFVRFASPGSFYSPIPRLDDVGRDADRLFDFGRQVPGVDLHVDEQLEYVERIATELASASAAGRRYHADNEAFGLGDALVLEGVLRLERPARIVEIGSGHSSALILDLVEEHLPGTAVTFVDPHPEVLRSLMREGDEERATIVERRAQDLPGDIVGALGTNDVLFVDSTHVVKTGSDVCHLVLDVLPAVPPGVLVHFHDIFWPFELPRAWVEEGRQWAECYLLRAFLADNPNWRIVLFNDYLGRFEVPFLQAHLPGFLANPGGSLWLRRVRA